MTGSQGAADGADVHGAVVTSLTELELDGEDLAASALALKLAQAIDSEDSGRTVAELAGKLLAVLESLGMTPAARKSIVPKGGVPNATPARAARDELRARRRGRGTDRAEAVDASSS